MEHLQKHPTHYYCPDQRKPCVAWVITYFDDCLCNLSDDISFLFGLTSLLFWGLAEIPQIFTNFTAKSCHGVSLPFLLAWVVGDIFNLAGCLLEPATLPTQFYTALLYTFSTLVLVSQSLYYDYLCQWLKCRGLKSFTNHVVEEEVKRPLLQPKSPSIGIPVPDSCRNYYFMSARSLAGSNTPSPGSWLYSKEARSGPSILVLQDSSSSEDESSDPILSKKSLSQPWPIPLSRSQGGGRYSGAGYGSLLATALYLPARGNGLSDRFYVGGEMEKGVYAQWLGWVMAAIYMGGRLPQILLNIKRGSVEGLNPLMFAFAVVANVTYVGSILVRTMEWEKLKPNMPWLLDAVVCVGLDLLIMLQYLYYKQCGKRRRGDAVDDKLHPSIIQPSREIGV